MEIGIKIVRSHLWVIALTIAALTALPALTTSAYASACVINVARGDVLNMRQRPTSRSPIVRAIPPRACNIRLRGQYQGNWGRVTYRGQTGWVNMRFIDEGGDEDGAIPASFCVNTPGDTLNFRSGPGTGFRVVGVGTHRQCGFTRLACQGRWCQLRGNGFTGWANMRFMRAR
ncbi:SH3 domain-containing protein [Pseudahrensia aquimaris]|uniref:SH3 domain-containing protein n=1 Tax=Pseudahrensia aquimaris TaxID=744461 RepID=A0ABW3FD13_9HYPH